MSVQLFPHRPKHLYDTILKKRLQTAKGIPSDSKDIIILLKTEMQILRDLADGSHYAHNSIYARPQMSDGSKRTAAARKANMIAYDEERRAKGDVMTIEEIERAVVKDQQREAAHRKQDETLDEVKEMQHVMQYAKCVTVRDAQVLEKRAIAAEKAEEERRIDMMMELERLKAIRMYEEREAKRNEDQKKGAAVICAQIEERENDRLRKVELRQQEQDMMQSHVVKMRDEDMAETSRKRECSRRLMEDVALANAEQIRLKSKHQEMEIEEDRQIAVYIEEKHRHDQEIADEQSRVRHEKEMEIARLRSMQERAQDKQAEIDELRAKRAQEQLERDHRAKERSQRERTAAINDDIRGAHEHQRYAKELLLAEQVLKDQEEFDRIIAARKAIEERELRVREKEALLRRENADALMKQIAEIEEQRRKERREKLEEGQQSIAERRERAAIVDAIRARKLEELEKLQVPVQYRQELLKKRSTGERIRP